VLLPRVDPGRRRSGWPVGLRDGALLVLFAAGLTAEEIIGLNASSITLEQGRLKVTVHREEFPWAVTLSGEFADRLLAWLTERRIWATTEPAFADPQGQISPEFIYQLLYRYRHRLRGKRRSRRGSPSHTKTGLRKP